MSKIIFQAAPCFSFHEFFTHGQNNSNKQKYDHTKLLSGTYNEALAARCGSELSGLCGVSSFPSCSSSWPAGLSPVPTTRGVHSHLRAFIWSPFWPKGLACGALPDVSPSPVALGFKLSSPHFPPHSPNGLSQLFPVTALCSQPSQCCSQRKITYLFIYLFIVCPQRRVSRARFSFPSTVNSAYSLAPQPLMNEQKTVTVSEWLPLWYTLPVTEGITSWLISKK